MSFFGPRTRVIFVVLAVGVVFLGVRTYSSAGEMTTLQPRFDGTCARLEGLKGAEDLVRDRAGGLVWAAGYDRRAARQGADEVGGYIKALAFPAAGPDPAPVSADLTPANVEAARPHGLDLHVDAAGVRRLFVISHPPKGGESGEDELLIFRIDGGPDAPSLTLERRLSHPLLANANDVAAIGPDAAYVSLDSEAEAGSLAALMEGVFGGASGKVLLIDPDGARLVAERLRYANGVAVSPDGGRVFVAETLGRSLVIYDRDPVTGDLTFVERAFVGTGLDNIDQDAEGRLFIGAHPKLLTFLGHAGDARKLSPSQVIMMDVNAKQGDQVYLNAGEQISGSSVAIVDVSARRMLIGSVFEPFVLACDLPETWRHSEAYPAARPQ